MNRTSSQLRSRFLLSPLVGARGVLLVGLLACAGGCEVEDPVAYILPADAGSGPLSTDDAGPSSAEAPTGEGLPPDCAQDAGTRVGAHPTTEC